MNFAHNAAPKTFTWQFVFYIKNNQVINEMVILVNQQITAVWYLTSSCQNLNLSIKRWSDMNSRQLICSVFEGNVWRKTQNNMVVFLYKETEVILRFHKNCSFALIFQELWQCILLATLYHFTSIIYSPEKLEIMCLDNIQYRNIRNYLITNSIFSTVIQYPNHRLSSGFINFVWYRGFIIQL